MARKSEAAREAVALALASGRSVRRAAADAGVSERAVVYWRRDPAFTARVRALRQELLDRAVSLLAGLGARAVAALRRNLSCGKPAVEVRAALGALEQLTRGIEQQDVLARLDAIEERDRQEGRRR
jgi:hypothetical protein